MNKRPFNKSYSSRGPHRSFKNDRSRPLQRKAYPMPKGDKCNPLCPFFVCTRNALVIVTKSYRGKIRKVAFCRLTGSECIGAECKFASCRINALLPDGRCAKALEKKTRKTTDKELFREMEEIEDYDVEDFL
ncbi:hypothetical protein [Staphylothermus hellenicus]|uniref:Uncharacterized protein n=1 Tax=Staphylothermus hellenicus (strain DSM 12710 / JCM 10830 / BK20S6-10-b1 / P8) TaxID=591019 RepID=D7D9I5_STAHD|nr:hypothetical protein [Staphylothermus hellenicus]ADI32431.1 hypothetical protein Shell_1339 [Staphylothermus hellenicus DSM 12710]